MWTALVRQLAVFLFTRRGKRIAIFVGLVLLCFLTALLTDSKMYLTAGVTGALTAVIVVALIVQFFRHGAKRRQRVRQEAEQAMRRAAAGQARSEKISNAKSAVAGAARAATGSAADVAGMAKTGIVGVRDRLSFWRKKEPTP